MRSKMMHLNCLYCFFAIILLSSYGCSVTKNSKSQCDSDSAYDYHNALWKQGYGFNNPNPERIRKGLKPVNFNGLEDKQEEKKLSFLEELACDAVEVIIKGTFCLAFGVEKRTQEEVMNNDIYGPQDASEAAQLKEIEESLLKR